MGDQEEDAACRACQAPQQLKHVPPRGSVEIAGRFVGEHEERLVGERARDGDTLLLATRQALGIVIHPVGETDLIEQATGRAGIEPVQFERQAHVLADGQRGQEIEGLVDEPHVPAPEQRTFPLVHRGEIPAGNDDATAIGRVDATDDVEERGLARAAAPDERDALARPRLEPDAVQHGPFVPALAVRMGDLAHPQGRGSVLRTVRGLYHGSPMIPIRDDNPTTIRPIVTVTLVALCTAVFLWQISLGADGFERAVYGLGMIPAVAFGDARLAPELTLIPAGLTVITSMFLHGGILHLAGNMLYLWIFGNNIEDVMGHGRFVVFYLVCGVAAALAQAASAPAAEIPMIGASGAVSGVLGAYLLLFPHARVHVVVPLGFFIYSMALPAMVVLGLWIGLQLLNSAFAMPEQGGIAWFAHIGGFVAGMVLIPFFKRRGVRLFNPPRNRRRG